MIQVAFIQKVRDARGKDGEEWVKRIPEIIKAYEGKWNIKVHEPFALSYNYVAPAERSNGMKAVLKLGFPGDKEFISECAGLGHFDGKGSVRLLQEDIDNGVMLLERVSPGVQLDKVGDDERENRIACSLLKRLHKPAPDDDRLINFGKGWLSGYKRHRDKFNGTTGLFLKCFLFWGRR